MPGGAVSAAPGLLDVLLSGVPSELILKLSGQNATCSLAETSRAAAASTQGARAAYRQRPRERGYARLFVLHNDRPTEKERDHYAQWRSGWEPQLRETELESWLPAGPLPRTYVRVDTLECDVDSDSDTDEVAGEPQPQWYCSRCTLLNSRTQLACSACGDAAPDTDTTPARSSEHQSTRSTRDRPYSISQFVRWRGCNARQFAGIHHGDLVIDEGQYRGHGTFVALWSSGATLGEHADDAGQLLLTPAIGLDGVMLPPDAWSVVETHGPQYYERAGYGSWLFAKIPVSQYDRSKHEQTVRENARAAAVAAAAGKEDAHDLRLRTHGAKAIGTPGDAVPTTDLPLPGPACDHLYCELRPATRLARQVAPRPSDYRLVRDDIKGDRRAAGAAGDPVWSNLPPREFTELELSSSSDLRWRQQQPVVSFLLPSAVHAHTDRSTTPTLWGAGHADTNSCGFPVLSEDTASIVQPPAASTVSGGCDNGTGAGNDSFDPNDGVLTEDMAYMMIAPSQQPIAARGAASNDRDAAHITRSYGHQGQDSFVHDGMARLYSNHWQNRTTGEQDAAVSHDQWMPAFVPAPTPLPTPDKRQTRTYHSTDTVRHIRKFLLVQWNDPCIAHAVGCFFTPLSQTPLVLYVPHVLP